MTKVEEAGSCCSGLGPSPGLGGILLSGRGRTKARPAGPPSPPTGAAAFATQQAVAREHRLVVVNPAPHGRSSRAWLRCTTRY